MKVVKFIAWAVLALMDVAIAFCCGEHFPAVAPLFWYGLGLLSPCFQHSLEDLFDTANWKISQRKLERGKLIDKNTLIRISFAYLFRIKVGNKYLLVKNARGTGKYQPVGGVYKFRGAEKEALLNLFQIVDDDKIDIDDSSRDDYRLRLKNGDLRKFVKRFDDRADRENIADLSREFKEELACDPVAGWDRIEYRVCGRHDAGLRFSDHFQICELLLADVVELLPTKEQEDDLRSLVERCASGKFRWATAEEIRSLGTHVASGDLAANIAEHSKKILQETQGELIQIRGTGSRHAAHLKY